MGEVIQLSRYRARHQPPALVADEPAVEASSVATACRAMAAGFRQMRIASLMLAEAAADLRDLVHDDPM
jgi:hypothetical protein